MGRALYRAASGAAAGERGALGQKPAWPWSVIEPPSPPPARTPQGDDNLRSTYSACMQQLLAAQGARPVKDILDVGAATGLSSLALLKAFPDAEVTGARLFIHAGRVG